jgi:uncharacterized protein
MPPLSLLIKPASSSCNLQCKYCFYHSIAENRLVKSYGLMSIESLELIVKKALNYSEHMCTFAFQGGEPTLVGLDFYKKLIEFEKKYNVNNVTINNALQTNGILIDEEWSKFLSENKFLVGISLDGPKDIHDNNRVDINNKGSFNKVMNAISLFNKFKVEYNVLCVVNAYVARHSNKIYNFFKANNLNYLQFIPCIDPLNEQSQSCEYTLDPIRYTYFLKSIFDLWYNDLLKGTAISIRYFDNLVGMFMGYKTEACGMSGTCECQFVVESDGGVYPCDFYVTDKWLMGNIKDMDIEELGGTEQVKTFINDSKHVDIKCNSCKWLKLCRGGCRRLREPFENEKPGLNRYCSSYEEFFDYSYERLEYLARKFSKQ